MPITDPREHGRILCVTSNFPRWEGDSTTPFVLHLCQDLQALGWEVDVVAPHAPGCAMRETLGGVKVERFRYLWPESQETVCYHGGALVNLRRDKTNFLKLPALVLSEWWAIYRRLRTRQYDLLHSHWILPQGFTGVLAAKPLGIPHVITVHGSDVLSLPGKMLGKFKRFALNRADIVSVNSSVTRKAVLNLTSKIAALHTIPTGVTNVEPNPKSTAGIRKEFRRENGPLLVFVGRLVYEKGIDDLINAAHILKARMPDLTVLVIGDGQDRPALEKQAEQLGVQDRVKFKGWVPPEQVPDYMAAGDIFVGPSKMSPEGGVEAQGLTFAEAMLAGCPVIATRSGGIPDIVRHEETGLLVSESAPDEITAAVEKLVNDPGLRNRLVNSGRELVREKYVRPKPAETFSAIFEDLKEPSGIA